MNLNLAALLGQLFMAVNLSSFPLLADILVYGFSFSRKAKSTTFLFHSPLAHFPPKQRNPCHAYKESQWLKLKDLIR